MRMHIMLGHQGTRLKFEAYLEFAERTYVASYATMSTFIVYMSFCVPLHFFLVVRQGIAGDILQVNLIKGLKNTRSGIY
ncbi:hypothetical protein BO82DRAFT_350494 [Aspergillus uvarum CBS 121591]|uniref:Uncharacterized protein n=1 Tax=Aspergillus uvarum CBS 121591 TaxID=1448315 RepID=A0A319CQ34_9EURO|nr:hypothetical protein BO82DRAFT_350494 [Aspergillus uvarum CBS 121591]PYH86241.1 hypothetical protein BO82DRAFT_350494 [Aspergillus uvarum CBS 121591]